MINEDPQFDYGYYDSYFTYGFLNVNYLSPCIQSSALVKVGECDMNNITVGYLRS